ncbi:hypothetical protein B566_EDAN009511 [Ephemera danica]|nr:hypothetical protein B566_EDAN009511 [Ephemera danica]
MEVASFSKTIEELRLEWKAENPVIMGKGLRMPQFEIVRIVSSNCQESFQIGNYSCLVAEFYLSRSVGFHLVQSYLPTILIVVISWVSFWMDVNSVPGRTTLGVTTLLAKWQDERLKHEEITEALDLNDPNLVKAIWKPEVYFPNAKHAEFQYVTVPNVLVRINPDGEILYMLRYPPM